MADEPLKNLFSGTAGVNKRRVVNPPADNTSGDTTSMARIKVLGVGGGGGNAVNRMVRAGLKSIDFIVVNTDAQALYHNEAAQKINIGKATTRGLGAGSNPEVGRQSAEESTEDLKHAMEGADMVITGMRSV
jgi:cell division protein FtsZ